MNRYLFKAKRKYNGEWIFGNLVYLRCEDKYYIMSYDTNIYNDEIVDYDHIIKDLDMDEIIPETICQYTGLNDKNDKMIFENDIVNYKTAYITRKKRGIVLYDNQYMGSYVISKSPKEKDILYADIFDLRDEKWDCKIIGNKFDEVDNNE